jgi:lysozyme
VQRFLAHNGERNFAVGERKAASTPSVQRFLAHNGERNFSVGERKAAIKPSRQRFVVHNGERNFAVGERKAASTPSVQRFVAQNGERNFAVGERKAAIKPSRQRFVAHNGERNFAVGERKAASTPSVQRFVAHNGERNFAVGERKAASTPSVQRFVAHNGERNFAVGEREFTAVKRKGGTLQRTSTPQTPSFHMSHIRISQLLGTAMLLSFSLLLGCTPGAGTSTADTQADSLAASAKADSLALAAQADSAAQARKAQGDLSPLGVTASSDDGQIDWAVAKADGMITFAYVRATMGEQGLDAQLGRNWPAVQREGILRGAYHHYRVGDDIGVQAKNFSKRVKLETGDLSPAVQLDQSSIPTNVRLDKKGVVKAIQGFLLNLEQAHGCKPILMTTPDFATVYLDGAGFADYKLWLLDPSGNPEPTVPATWATPGWSLWQYSGADSLPGFSGKAARSKFHAPMPEFNPELACAKP